MKNTQCLRQGRVHNRNHADKRLRQNRPVPKQPGAKRPVSSEISDLYEISDLLLFASYFSSQSKGIKFSGYAIHVCTV